MGRADDMARSMRFSEFAKEEIEREFDRIWPRDEWYPRRDDDGNMLGIAWGWGIEGSGQIRMIVTNAGEDTPRFENAIYVGICKAIDRMKVEPPG